jgi:hypothetical protein
MQKQEVRQINGFEVTTVQLPPTRAYRLLAKVGRVLTPTLGALGGKKLDGLKSIDFADLGPALSAMFAQLDDAAADALMLETLASTSVVTRGDNGQLIKYDLTSKAWIDLAFAGDVMALLLTMKFALEVNFRSFFAASAGSEQPAAQIPSS